MKHCEITHQLRNCSHSFAGVRAQSEHAMMAMTIGDSWDTLQKHQVASAHAGCSRPVVLQHMNGKHVSLFGLLKVSA
jgi:hypothetical protein